METAVNSPKVSFEDFHEVPDLKFDIERLRDDLEKILEKKKSEPPIRKTPIGSPPHVGSSDVPNGFRRPTQKM